MPRMTEWRTQGFGKLKWVTLLENFIANYIGHTKKHGRYDFK